VNASSLTVRIIDADGRVRYSHTIGPER
jgi:hypothetical protein